MVIHRVLGLLLLLGAVTAIDVHAQQTETKFPVACPKRLAITKLYEKAIADKIKTQLGDVATDIKVRVKLKLTQAPSESEQVSVSDITDGLELSLTSNDPPTPLGINISGHVGYVSANCDYTYHATVKASGKIDGVRKNQTSEGDIHITAPRGY